MQFFTGVLATVWSLFVFIVPIVAIFRVFQIGREVSEIKEIVTRLEISSRNG